MSRQIVVGRVVAPRGVKGELKVVPLMDDPDFFLRCDAVSVVAKGETESRRITGSWWHDGMLILTLDGLSTRDEAEAFRGCDITVPASVLPRPSEDRHYYFELEGLEVVTRSGDHVGVLDHIMETGSNDVYVILDRNRREILIPAIREVVVDIDVQAGRIVIDPMEGMLD